MMLQQRTDPSAFAAMPTLGHILRYWADHRPDQIALSFEGRDTSYAGLARASSQVANAMMQESIGFGSHVGYVGKNCDGYFEILLGAARIGAVVTPIGWRLAAPEIAFILSDAEISLLFVGPEVFDTVRLALAEMAYPPRIIAMEPRADTVCYEKWRDAAPDHDPAIAIDAGDVVLQIYTSGTTGRPKGAMLSHRNILGGAQAAAEAKLGWNEWAEDDVALVAMPIGHIGGTRYGLAALLNGAKAVIARDFDPAKVLASIEGDRISKISLVPAALQMLVRLPHARQVDFSRIRHILYGASPIPLDLLREAMDVTKARFCQQYGMTETCGTIAYLPADDHDVEGTPRMRAAGIPLPGVELRILDSDGNTLPPDTIGEVAVRSVANMVGYWKQPEATAKTLQVDGWLLTGDAGYLDRDGYLFIHDRVKDMIISGAENIYPAEVESAVYGHPDVADVAIIGVPDERWGETLKAIVVLKDGRTSDPASIIAFARSRIAAFKAPTSVDFVKALPRNASGKVLRRDLRDPYWAGYSRKVN